MWPISLSARLPIVGTVGRYPAVYLMGREPLSLRIAPLTTLSCGTVVLCGISNRFRLLSPSKRQVAHALLTRSPLSMQSTNHSVQVLVTFYAYGIAPYFLRQSCVSHLSVLVTFDCLRNCSAIPGAGEAIGASHTPFDLHVLGTPPAFVLSQDQTLEFNLSVSFNTVAHFLLRLVVFLFASVILISRS